MAALQAHLYRLFMLQMGKPYIEVKETVRCYPYQPTIGTAFFGLLIFSLSE